MKIQHFRHEWLLIIIYEKSQKMNNVHFIYWTHKLWIFGFAIFMAIYGPFRSLSFLSECHKKQGNIGLVINKPKYGENELRNARMLFFAQLN